MPNAPKVLQAYNGALLKRKQKRLDKKRREAAAAKRSVVKQLRQKLRLTEPKLKQRPKTNLSKEVIAWQTLIHRLL